MGELARAGIVTVATIILLIIVAVAVVLPYGILVRATECGHFHAADRAPRAKISEVYDSLKTGDILLFASSVPVLSNIGITQTLYSHAALLCRSGDIITTSEAQMGAELVPAASATATGAAAATHMRPGAASAPLLTRIKYYSGRVYVMRLSRELDSARERRLTAAADALHRAEYPYPTAAQACAAAVFGTPAPARHCFQHVAYLLGVAGLGFGSGAGIIQVCRDVCGIANRPLADGFFYESPIELLYDIDALTF
jgi:hypothetical protein